jgi:hypothetical protein
MGSEWAKEADRQAKALERELAGLWESIRVSYQRREARFALKAGSATTYFSAHIYQTPKGMDWRRLRLDILAEVERKSEAGEVGTP